VLQKIDHAVELLTQLKGDNVDVASRTMTLHDILQDKKQIQVKVLICLYGFTC
jgi:hypothetical protein